MQDGPMVDQILDCEDLTSLPGLFDVVLSCELLEHAENWKQCIDQMVQVVAPGGLLLITTRSHGFPYHPYPEDHWRFTHDDMKLIARAYGLYVVELENDSGDPGVFLLARKPADWQYRKPQMRLEAEKVSPPIPMAGTGTPLKGEPNQRLMVAYPLYRHVPAQWVINWFEIDKTMVTGYTATQGVYVTLAWAKLFAAAMRTDTWDRLVIVEADMILPKDAFNRIACYGPEYDIVGSAYFQHQFPYEIMAWHQQNPPWYVQITGDEQIAMMDEPGLYPCDAVGWGLTSVARHVIENWNSDVLMFEPDLAESPVRGHDFIFCERARKQGFKVFVDSGLRCGHLTETAIGFGHSQAALAETAGLETWADAMDGELSAKVEVGQ